MALPTISAGDLLNKGTTGMPANPELSFGDLQAKFDELSLDVIVPKFQDLVTALENASAGVDLGVTAPTGIAASDKVKSVLDAMSTILLALKDKSDGDYDDLVTVFTGITAVSNVVDGLATTIPTSKAIADFIQEIGGGDMLRITYDTDSNGIVDNSERLGGELPSHYATQQELVNINTELAQTVAQINNDLMQKADIETTNDQQIQINNLVLQAGNPESSSAEIVQMRKNYSTANDRIDDTEDKVNEFYKENFSSNLFNIATFAPNLEFLASDGTTRANASGYGVSDYIPVQMGKTIYFSYLNGTTQIATPVQLVCAYNASKVFLAASTNWINTYTVPANCSYIRVCVHETPVNSSFKAEYDAITAYAKYSKYTELIADNVQNSIKSVSTKAIGINLFNIGTINVAKELVTLTGVLKDNTIGYSVSDFIDVEEGQMLYFSYNRTLARTVNKLCAYDKACNFIFGSTVTSISSYSVPIGAKFIRFCDETTLLNTNYQVTVGTLPTAYNRFRNISNIDAELTQDDERITDLESAVNSVSDMDILIPTKLNVCTGVKQYIYFSNTILNKNFDCIHAVKPSGFSNQYLPDYVEVSVNDSSVATNANLGYYENDYNHVVFASVNINPVRSTAGSGQTKNCIFIGDSITEFEQYVDEVARMFSTDAMHIDLLGTRTTSLGNKHEGRSGWRAWNYAFEPDASSDGLSAGVTNPFYNPSVSKFDFAYYMSQQGYTGVDYVFLNIGTNDMVRATHTSSADTLNAWNTIIDSIHAYNSNIKVVCWITPPQCKINGTGLTVKDTLLVHKKIIMYTYSNRENQNIFVCPVYLNIDPINDFVLTDVPLSTRNAVTTKVCTDITHPATSGYMKIADSIYTQIKYLASLV